MFTTYILYSTIIGKYYIGQTIDLVRRIEEHNRGKTRFMARGVPWKLVFAESFSTRDEAVEMKRAIKKRGAGRFLKKQRHPYRLANHANGVMVAREFNTLLA